MKTVEKYVATEVNEVWNYTVAVKTTRPRVKKHTYAQALLLTAHDEHFHEQETSMQDDLGKQIRRNIIKKK